MSTGNATADYAGNDSARQSIGLPGHCDECARVGHVAAHPDLGCGDVGCTRAHGPDDTLTAQRAAADELTRMRVEEGL